MRAFKRHHIALAALIVGFSGTPPAAHASVWIQSGLTAMESTDTMTGSDVSDFRLVTNSTVGYSFIQGFLVGFQALTTRSTLTSSSNVTWGPKGGFFYRGFEVTAAYLVMATDVSASGERTGGGFAINLGYTAKVAGPFRMGFMLSYWQMSYANLNGSPLIVRQRTTNVSPQLSLGLEF